jgi:hypothetical protein
LVAQAVDGGGEKGAGEVKFGNRDQGDHEQA